MRYKEFLKESDNRDVIQKLMDLASHPNTEDTIKTLAIERLKKRGIDFSIKDESPKRPSVTIIPAVRTNLSPSQMDMLFSIKSSKTCGQILNEMTSLSPVPTYVNFKFGGILELQLNPPFTTTAGEYIQAVKNIIPGIAQTNLKYNQDRASYTLTCKVE